MGAGKRHYTQLLPNVAELGNLGGAQNRTTLQRLLWMSRGSTIQLVNNCEAIADWSIEDTAQLNAVIEDTDIVTGTYSLELVDVGTTKGTVVELAEEKRPDHEDWTWANYLCFYVHDDTAVRLAGELTFQIRNGVTWGAEIAVPVVSNADVFEYKAVYIGGENRSDVTGFRFVNQRGTGSSEKVYIDSIIVTDIVAGCGNGVTVAVGPVIGKILPMRLETGSIYPGNIANMENGLLTAGAADDTQLIGPVCCTKDALVAITAAATILKEVWVAQEGSLVHMRTDGSGGASGDACKLGASGLVITEMSTTVEKAFCRAMDAFTANEDELYRIGGTFADD